MKRPSPSRASRSCRHWVAALAGGRSAYFLIVFGTGFVLGAMRTLWLVPLLGVRWAELPEIPVMLLP